jgi:hypothetical protein
MCYDPATKICGNNTIESGEACDDGAQTGQPGHCGPVCDPSYPAGLCVKDDNATSGSVCNCNNVSCGDSVVSQTCNPATTLAGDGEINTYVQSLHGLTDFPIKKGKVSPAADVTIFLGDDVDAMLSP